MTTYFKTWDRGTRNDPLNIGKGTSVSYCMVCASVREDNQRV